MVFRYFLDKLLINDLGEDSNGYNLFEFTLEFERGKEEERKRKGRGKREERKRKGRGKEEERKRKGREKEAGQNESEDECVFNNAFGFLSFLLQKT